LRIAGLLITSKFEFTKRKLSRQARRRTDRSYQFVAPRTAAPEAEGSQGIHEGQSVLMVFGRTGFSAVLSNFAATGIE
jgi:hypothetical protein